jgi:hypothetical protein
MRPAVTELGILFTRSHFQTWTECKIQREFRVLSVARDIVVRSKPLQASWRANKRRGDVKITIGRRAAAAERRMGLWVFANSSTELALPLSEY